MAYLGNTRWPSTAPLFSKAFSGFKTFAEVDGIALVFLFPKRKEQIKQCFSLRNIFSKDNETSRESFQQYLNFLIPLCKRILYLVVINSEISLKSQQTQITQPAVYEVATHFIPLTSSHSFRPSFAFSHDQFVLNSLFPLDRRSVKTSLCISFLYYNLLVTFNTVKHERKTKNLVSHWPPQEPDNDG